MEFGNSFMALYRDAKNVSQSLHSHENSLARLLAAEASITERSYSMVSLSEFRNFFFGGPETIINTTAGVSHDHK